MSEPIFSETVFCGPFGIEGSITEEAKPMQGLGLMEGVREYGEEMGVSTVIHENGREVIRALNEAGHNCTDVDLLDLIEWVKKNRPELL